MADILHVVDIHASANAVYQTVGSVEGISRWWSTSVEGSDNVGGSVGFFIVIAESDFRAPGFSAI